MSYIPALPEHLADYAEAADIVDKFFPTDMSLDPEDYDLKAVPLSSELDSKGLLDLVTISQWRMPMGRPKVLGFIAKLLRTKTASEDKFTLVPHDESIMPFVKEMDVKRATDHYPWKDSADFHQYDNVSHLAAACQLMLVLIKNSPEFPPDARAAWNSALVHSQVDMIIRLFGRRDTVKMTASDKKEFERKKKEGGPRFAPQTQPVKVDDNLKKALYAVLEAMKDLYVEEIVPFLSDKRYKIGSTEGITQKAKKFPTDSGAMGGVPKPDSLGFSLVDKDFLGEPCPGKAHAPIPGTPYDVLVMIDVAGTVTGANFVHLRAQSSILAIGFFRPGLSAAHTGPYVSAFSEEVNDRKYWSSLVQKADPSKAPAREMPSDEDK
jgi:hypothetical protein